MSERAEEFLPAIQPELVVEEHYQSSQPVGEKCLRQGRTWLWSV